MVKNLILNFRKMNEAITMFKRLKEIYCSKHNYDFEFIWIII